MNDLRAHQRSEDKGFTLIELMVVVLIIAILLAIAIPTFLGAQNKAKDRSAQSSARNSLTNAKTIYADSATYLDADVTNLQKSEPSLTFLATAVASDGPKKVSIDTADANTWYAAVWSDAGNCFYIKDSVAATGAGTTYAKGTVQADCTGTKAATLTYLPKW
jgi:type IV pilus assembly protein PilA